MPNPLEIDSFKTDRLVLEWKYGPAFLNWDRSGSVGSQIKRRIGDVSIVAAAPSAVHLRSRAERTDFIFEQDSSRVVSYQPNRDCSRFCELSEFFISTVASEFDIEEFKRVGFRQLLATRLSSVELASRVILDTGLLQVPDQVKMFGVEAKPSTPVFGLRWEGRSNGATLLLRTESRTAQVEGPIEFDVDFPPVKEDFHLVVVDFDYFTTSQMPLSSFNTNAWVDGAVHALRRDFPKLFI